MQRIKVLTKTDYPVEIVGFREHEDGTLDNVITHNSIKNVKTKHIDIIFEKMGGYKAHCVGFPHTANNIIGKQKYITESKVTPMTLHVSYIKYLLKLDPTITHYAYVRK
jgi:hypothetical protein